MASSWDAEIAPDWDEVDNVREAAGRFLGSLEIDAEVVDAVTMVACELTENAIKYGEFQSEDRISVSITERPHGILVEVKNPIGEGAEEHLMKLDEMIQWIRGYQDPFEAYLERLEEVSKRALEDEESGLGLVRIAYEGQSLIDFYVDDKNTLAVSAVYQL